MRYKLWLQAERYDIVAFYPYTSVVSTRILEQSHNRKTEEHDFIQKFADDIQNKAEKLGCVWDNKVVVEIQLRDLTKIDKDQCKDSNLFVGYYNGKISIGLGVWLPDAPKNTDFEKFKIK